MGNILVTGATGNVGLAVVKHLTERKQQVIAAVIDIDKEPKKLPPNIEYRMFDFLNPELYKNSLEDVDRVFLMRPPQLGNPKDLEPFVRELKDRNIKLLVFLSLLGVEKNPFPPHGKIEKQIVDIGLPYSFLRPSFFMQNLTGLHLEDIVKHNEIIVPVGRSRTSFIDADDIGKAAAVCLADPEKYKNTKHTLTGPEALNYYKVAEIFSRVLGRKVSFKNPSFFRYRGYMKERGFEKDYINVTTLLYLMTRVGTANLVNDDFYKLTGEKPTTFEEFVIKHKSKFY
jgi:uncharacterized protein YbjT (DUF2867 family)